MLLVVCDSTPLIYLTRIGRFELLKQLHEEVLIPQAVWDEVGVAGGDLPEGVAIRAAAAARWLRVERPVGQLAIAPSELDDLDPGETEAIQLAVERGALLAIDESHGREIATRLGLKLTGTVGILMRARHQGLVPDLRAELQRLRQTTFRLSLAVCRDALLSVGESTEGFSQ
jgi:predicted nucleic acid-binding protein